MTLERTASPSSSAVAAVLVGGSAGALDPLAALLAALPEALEAPIVVLLHVQRHVPSLLPEILARKTRRPVREPRDKEPLASGAIYVAPPDYHLLIADGPSFALSVEEPVNYSIPSIDVLFESAADALGEGAAAILLSGASADGARGLAAVARAGGLVAVQPPEEAESRVMPQAGLDACPAARVVPAREMNRFLCELASRSSAARRETR